MAGRPPKSARDRRGELLRVRVRSDEYEAIKKAAAAQGESISDYVRRVLRDHLNHRAPNDDKADD